MRFRDSESFILDPVVWREIEGAPGHMGGGVGGGGVVSLELDWGWGWYLEPFYGSTVTNVDGHCLMLTDPDQPAAL